MKKQLSYSVVKSLFINLWHPETPLKDLIRQFLKDKKAILSYIETLKWDIDVIQDDFDTAHYIKGVKELTELVETL